MKKLLYTLLAVSIIFSACDKEEESNSNSNINITVSNMTGIWKATSLILDGANQAILATILYKVNSDMTIEEDVEFNNNPGNIIDNSGTWELSGTNLIINWVTEEKTTYHINSLSSTTASLILVEYLNDSGDIKHDSGSCNLVKQ